LPAIPDSTVRKFTNVSLSASTADHIIPEGGLIGSKSAIDALGSFIANRFKQEVEIAFLQKFKEWLQKEPFLQQLFPETFKVLMQNDPYEYTTFLEALKEALSKDVKSLPKI
jgi:hypothetical protein